MSHFSKMHKSHFLCAVFLLVATLIFSACDEPLPQELDYLPKSEISVSNTDVFVMTDLKDLVTGFDYNLYEDSACTNKNLYSTASYFMYLGNTKFYFSNKYEYDSENKTLYVEVIKNAQLNKDRNAFLFTETNGSYLTTLKITGISSIMLDSYVEVYENSFHSTDYQSAWNNKTEHYTKLGNLYYKLKPEYKALKALPVISNSTFYLLDTDENYLKTYDNKAYCLKFNQFDMERSNHSQNLYQITNDDDYYYFGFSQTSRESYYKALQDNYLGMPAIVRVSFSSDNTKITISDSLYLCQAKPTLEDQNWNDKTYTLTETEPAPEAGGLPTAQEKSLEEMQTLAKSLTGDYYWKNLSNLDAQNETDGYYMRFWFGTLANVTESTTVKEYFHYARIKGMKRGAGKYNENTTTQPADDIYTDEIFTDGTDIYVIGHLATKDGNAAPKGAVYAPNEDDTGKFALWVITSEGVKTSQLFATIDECKTGSYEFTLYSWQ